MKADPKQSRNIVTFICHITCSWASLTTVIKEKSPPKVRGNQKKKILRRERHKKPEEERAVAVKSGKEKVVCDVRILLGGAQIDMAVHFFLCPSLIPNMHEDSPGCDPEIDLMAEPPFASAGWYITPTVFYRCLFLSTSPTVFARRFFFWGFWVTFHLLQWTGNQLPRLCR